MGLVSKALQREELSSLLWIFLFGFVIGAAVSLFDLASVSGFLSFLDYSSLPGAFVSSGLLGVFAANSFISFQNWISYTRIAFYGLILITLTVLSLIAGGWWYGVQSIVYISFILAGPITVIGALLFKGLFERVFDLSQGRKFLFFAESGMIAGCLAILLYAVFVFPYSGNAVLNLLYYSFLFCPLAFFILLILSFRFNHLTKIRINVQYINAYNNYPKLLRQGYTLRLILFSFFAGLCFYLTEYFFLRFTDQEFQEGGDQLRFIAGFSAAAISIAFALKYLTNRINSKYGFFTSLLILPCLVFLFTSIFAGIGAVNGYIPEESVFFFIFMLVCISRLLSFSLSHSVESYTFRNFFLPLDSLLREDIQSKVTVVVKEGAKVFAAIFISIVLYSLDFEMLPWFLLVILGVAAFVTYKLNQAYKEKLLITLKFSEKVVKKNKVSVHMVDELERKLLQNQDNLFPVYLSLVKIIDPVRYKGIIYSLLSCDREEVQELALKEASELCLLEGIPVLEKVKESKFYPILKTRDLIDRVYERLKAARFRLEKVKYIEQLTLSKIERERVYGALLSAYAEEENKPRLLLKLFRDESQKVKYGAVISTSNSSDKNLQKVVIEKLSDSSYSNASLSVIVNSDEKFFHALENAFYLSGQEEAIQLRIVQAYGRVGTETAVQMLIKKLAYTNQNVAREAFEQLSQCGYTIEGERAILLRAELEEYISVLVWNISALIDLVEFKSSELIQEAVRGEIDSNYDKLFKLLSLLYDPSVIALVRLNIFSVDPEKSEYAYGLLVVTLEEREKSFLLPVMNNLSMEEKLKRIDPFFPSQSHPHVTILRDLVQRDYKYVNRWTKACALKELSILPEKVDPDIFLANLVNPDALLKETSLISLFIKYPELIPSSFERFKKEIRNTVNEKIINEVLDVAQDVKMCKIFELPHLKFDMISFLKKVKEFSDIPGSLLIEVARIMNLYFHEEGELIYEYPNVELMDYYLVRKGRVEIIMNGISLSYEENSFIHNFSFLSYSELSVRLVSDTSCEIYKINRDKLNELLSNYQEITFSFMNHCKSNAFSMLVEKELLIEE